MRCEGHFTPIGRFCKLSENRIRPAGVVRARVIACGDPVVSGAPKAMRGRTDGSDEASPGTTRTHEDGRTQRVEDEGAACMELDGKRIPVR